MYSGTPGSPQPEATHDKYLWFWPLPAALAFAALVVWRINSTSGLSDLEGWISSFFFSYAILYFVFSLLLWWPLRLGRRSTLGRILISSLLPFPIVALMVLIPSPPVDAFDVSFWLPGLAAPGRAIVKALDTVVVVDTCSISPWDAGRHGLVASFQAAAFQPDGKILLAGDVGQRALPGGARRLLRLTQSGELDPSFLAGDKCLEMVAPSPEHLRVLPSGDIVMAWGYSYPDGLVGQVGGPVSLPVLLKLDRDGQVQQQIARLRTRSGKTFFGDIHSLHVESNGRVILSGNFSEGALHPPASSGSIRELALLALTPEGYVDEQFLSASLPGPYLEAGPMVRDSRGRALACLSHRIDRRPDIGGLLAFGPDGRPDAGLIDKAREFAPGEECIVAVQPDDRILLGAGKVGGGSLIATRFYRLQTDGSLDSSFPRTPFPEGIHRLLVAADGKLVGLKPSGRGLSSWSAPGVVRLNPDGSPDPAFNDAAAASLALVDSIVTDTVALRSDGALFVMPYGSAALAAPVLLRADGTVDPGFRPPRPQAPEAGSKDLGQPAPRGVRPSLTGRCKYKTITVPTDNGHDLVLNSTFELRKVEAAMRSKEEYEIRSRLFGYPSDELGELYISRTFDGVKYTIVLSKTHLGRNAFNLHTVNFDGYPSGSVAGGASCRTPDRVIRGNVIRMIQDLPLTSPQRRELVQNVRVAREVDLDFDIL